MLLSVYEKRIIEEKNLRNRIIEDVKFDYGYDSDVFSEDEYNRKIIFVLLYDHIVEIINDRFEALRMDLVESNPRSPMKIKDSIKIKIPYSSIYGKMKLISEHCDSNYSLPSQSHMLGVLNDLNTVPELKFDIIAGEFRYIDSYIMTQDYRTYLEIDIDKKLIQDTFEYRYGYDRNADNSIYKNMSLADRIKSRVPANAIVMDDMNLRYVILKFLHNSFIEDLNFTDQLIDNKFAILKYDIDEFSEILKDYLLIEQNVRENYKYMVLDLRKFVINLDDQINEILENVEGVTFMIENSCETIDIVNDYFEEEVIGSSEFINTTVTFKVDVTKFI